MPTNKATTKKTMTIEEAKKMEGTEFIYKYKDGDTIPAFVKKFDAEVGLTCMTLATKTTRDGWSNPHTEVDGTWCVMGHRFDRDDIKETLEGLAEIKETGRYEPTCGGPGVTCAFM